MQEKIHANQDAAKRREAGKKKRTRPDKVTPHDGDIFTISLDNGKSYIGQVIATPDDVDTYIVVSDLLVDEEEASEHIAEALSSSPLYGRTGHLPLQGQTPLGNNSEPPIIQAGQRPLSVRLFCICQE